MLASRKLLFDQLTPITIFAKLQKYFEGELSFLFESAINNSEGNFSFLFIGARERIIHQHDKSIHIDEEGNTYDIGENPFKFLKQRYALGDQTRYKEIGRASCRERV